MPLVNYSDSDSDFGSDSCPHSSARAPPAKKQKTASVKSHPVANKLAATNLPPLPPGFLDLYASSVRASTVDDPALHQGRKRQTPHVVGNWPSHLYIEWYPSASQHAVLCSLFQRITAVLPGDSKVHSLLESELGTILPLHISLSRPVVFTTGQKDRFLDAITTAVHGARVHPFTVSPCDLYWYTSPDSERTFLVLRVSSCAPSTSSSSSLRSNAQLAALLRRCNQTVQEFDQPVLYALQDQESVDTSIDTDTVSNVDHSAFHVSIAWTFDVPSQRNKQTVQALLLSTFAEIKEWKLAVDSIKAKIGNVVTNIPLKSTVAAANNLFT
ncbi:hypothetical protein BROUX41_005085 [Berkeleyomyces rouxiae]|uniref:uncharacterized protein n=1 Tax=Berkeleyomyces rouxiae TaxID=2035830 RepID=UPI003B7E3A59